MFFIKACFYISPIFRHFSFAFLMFFMLALFVVSAVKCVPWDSKVWSANPGRILFLFDVCNNFTAI